LSETFSGYSMIIIA